MDDIDHTSWKAFALLFGLAFSMNTLLMLGGTYSDALFISTYPTQWLTWYFFASPIVTILLYLFFTPYLSSTQPRQSFFFIIATAIALIISHWLMATQIYVIPFIVCLCLSISSKLIYILSWNAIAASLDIRVFKHHVFQLNTVGSIGQISICFLIPAIVHYFHSSGLFYATLLAYVITALCILILKPLPNSVIRPRQSLDTKLSKQYFFKSLFILTMITLFIDTLVNYSFRSALIGHFTQDGLATFISLFNGCLSTAGVITELLIASRLLFLIGISGILLLTPITCVILGITTAIWPSFLSMMILRAAQTFFRNNFTTPFMQVIVYPYPTAVRKKVSLYLSGYATPIGAIIGVSIIFIINTWLNSHFFGLCIGIAALCWVTINRKIHKGYQDMLHASLKENRYHPDLLNLTPESALLMREDILTALNSADINVVRTGLEFFSEQALQRHSYDQNIQEAISKKLSDPEMDVRYKAALALKKLNAATAAKPLLAQLNFEKKTSVGWAILDTLIHLHIMPGPVEIEKYRQSNQPFKVAYGLITLDYAEEPYIQNKARDEFNRLSLGGIEHKLLLANTVHYLRPTPEHNQQLLKLMLDTSDKVSIQAIKAVTFNSSTEFTSALLDFLNSKSKAWYAEKALAEYQDKILDQLLMINLALPKRQQFSMVRLLAKSSSLTALHKLIALSKSSHVSLRLLIAKSVLRESKYNLTKTLATNAVVNMIEWIAREIHCLLQLNTTNNEGVKHEINVQLYINRCVFIIWFGLLTDINRVTAVAHYIEKPDHYNSTDLARAYELLDSLATNSVLRHAVELISENHIQNQLIHEQQTTINQSILWLAQHPFKYQQGTPMNTMDKIALLRRVKLFDAVPVESLQAIADISKERDMAVGEYIFKDKDETDHFYCIVSGKVAIKKGDHILSELHEADYFGELGILDGMPRTANAIATHNGALLYIEKEDFLNVLEDLPEIMRAVVGQIVRYLRQDIEEIFLPQP